MSKIYTVPTTDLVGTLAIAIGLQQSAEQEGKLPALLKDGYTSLGLVIANVQGVLADAGPDDNPNIRALDIVIDRNWRLTRDFLTVWAELGADGVSDQAQTCLDSVFGPDGLAFTQERVEKELAESTIRLANPLLEPAMTALGGQLMYEALVASHDAYADGIHAVPAPKLDRAGMLSDLRAATQEVLHRIAASINRNDPASVERGGRLMRAITEWRAKAKHGTKKQEPVAGPTPSPTPEPVGNPPVATADKGKGGDKS